jgi:hypothetical protein
MQNPSGSFKATLMTVGEYVAETIEAEAARMPPSMKDYADCLLRMAANERQFHSTSFVRVWEPISVA